MKSTEARYYCDSCMRDFMGCTDERPAACPHCGRSGFVSKSLSGRAIFLLIAAALLLPLAWGLWNRLSLPDAPDAPPPVPAAPSHPAGR
ncbi:MAG: hypothetical protein V4689_07205 [Verrucomicrobiota bacterium]